MNKELAARIVDAITDMTGENVRERRVAIVEAYLNSQPAVPAPPAPKKVGLDLVLDAVEAARVRIEDRFGAVGERSATQTWDIVELLKTALAEIVRLKPLADEMLEGRLTAQRNLSAAGLEVQRLKKAAAASYIDGWKKGVTESIDKLFAYRASAVQTTVGAEYFDKAIELLNIRLQHPPTAAPTPGLINSGLGNLPPLVSPEEAKEMVRLGADDDDDPYEGSFREAADNEGARIAAEDRAEREGGE